MITMGQAEVSVTTKLPPTQGEFVGWDWQNFYNAILHVMQNRRSQQATTNAYRLIESLPASMVMTPQVVTAAWARFSKLYPGWKSWDYQAAYRYMLLLLRQTRRLRRDDGRQWIAIEKEWQEMEIPQVRFIPAAEAPWSGHY